MIEQIQVEAIDIDIHLFFLCAHVRVWCACVRVCCKHVRARPSTHTQRHSHRHSQTLHEQAMSGCGVCMYVWWWWCWWWCGNYTHLSESSRGNCGGNILQTVSMQCTPTHTHTHTPHPHKPGEVQRIQSTISSLMNLKVCERKSCACVCVCVCVRACVRLLCVRLFRNVYVRA